MSNARADALGNPASTPSDVLLALADRCEREEPSRELDSRIAFTLGALTISWDSSDEPWVRGKELTLVPRYTTSLDAAVTLEPSDAQEVCVRKYPGGGVYVRLTTASGKPVYSLVTNRPITEPMSRVSVYLRARAAVLKPSGITPSSTDGEDGGTT